MISHLKTWRIEHMYRLIEGKFHTFNEKVNIKICRKIMWKVIIQWKVKYKIASITLIPVIKVLKFYVLSF